MLRYVNQASHTVSHLNHSVVAFKKIPYAFFGGGSGGVNLHCCFIGSRDATAKIEDYPMHTLLQKPLLY